MLGFIRRRRSEKLKREGTRLGNELMSALNVRIEQWQTERLETRREMLAAMFDERVVSLEPEDGLSLEEMLEIEAIALLKNWDEAKDEYVKEGSLYLTDEDVEFLNLIDGGERFTEVLYGKVAEAGRDLAEHIDRTIAEEVNRRGSAKLEKPIDQMTFPEVAAFIRANENLLANDAIAAARRLTDIAMFDHGVSDEERELALNLIPALDADIEAALKNQPGAFEAYLEAVTHHRGSARYCGYGSLQWKMDEEGVKAAEVIPFMARPEHAELLPACLEMFEPDVILEIRPALISELATSRGQEGEGPIDVLCRLASGDDGALTQLLDGAQLGALRRASSNPEAAEAVLNKLGVQF